MKSFRSYNSYSGLESLAPLPSDFIDVRVLAANAAERHQVPTGAKFVVFSANGDFFVRFGDNTVAATVPAADVTDGSGSELNPTAREIGASTYVSLIAAAATIITMSWYGS